ncbi:MAG: Hsp20/alpha crystallin family protein [Deltaproteobacteria bacterium]|jgi:HSP20 family protein|nr:Hsp20/alpha crystallin family protein [Deltaproteobacteria bacterium]
MTIFHTFRGLDPAKFLEFSMMRDRMDKIWNSLRGGFDHIRDNFSGVFPLINVGEDDDSIIISAELPGVKAEDLNISVKNDTVIVKGEKKVGPHPQEANFYRKERHEGVFSRIVTLPSKIEAEKVEALFKNGILTVTLPKAAEAKSHQVSIKSE